MKVVCSEALLLGLHDDDISVVGSVLSIDGLEKLVNAMEFLTSVMDVLARCNELFEKGNSTLLESEFCNVLARMDCLTKTTENLMNSIYCN